MLTAFLLSSLSFFRPDYQPGDKSELASQVRTAYAELATLSFEARVSGYQWASYGKTPPRGWIRELFKVWMADGPKYRVEMLEFGELTAVVVCDGTAITEWNARNNLYTTYVMPTFDEEFQFGSRLGPSYDIYYFCECWVDGRGPFGPGLERTLANPRTRRTKPRVVNGRDCETFVLDEHEGFLEPAPAYSAGHEVLCFDPVTHLLAKQKTAFTLLGLVVCYQRLTTTFRNVQPNVELPPDIFVFKPPEGAKFIPPDDPRFKAKEIVQLTGKSAPAFSLPRVEQKRSREQTSEDEAKQQADVGVQDKPEETKPVSLAEFKDKKAVLVVFWGTWCLPCQKEIPSLIKLHEEFSDKGLAVVGICGGERSEKDVQEFLKKRPLPYTILYDGKQEATQAYGAKSVPYTILIDKSGTVVRVWQGWSGEEEEKQIREEVGKLLTDSTTAPADREK